MQVRFEGVSKRFGAHAALRAIDLEVRSGECLVLLGPSGCGKTTLLRLLAGLERADEGRIWIGDRVVNDVEPAERDVALLLDAFESALEEAYDRKAPNPIAEHAYRLASAFSRFYAACPVLGAAEEGARGSRLALSKAVLDQLELALDLLGISTPERM